MHEIKTLIPNVFMMGQNEKIDPDKFTENGNYYFIYGVNIWHLLISPTIKCLLPCDNTEKLLKEWLGENPADPDVGLSYPHTDLKISTEEFTWTMQYLRQIFQKFGTEGVVVLMYHADRKEFKVLPVVQYNMSKSHVSYIFPGNPTVTFEAATEKQAEVKKIYDEMYEDGYRMYGTIHSHSDFSAFYSGIDDHDDEVNDGIHITIGNVVNGWTYAARHTVRGFHFDLEIEDVINTTTDELERLVESGEVKVDDKYMSFAIINRREPSRHPMQNFTKPYQMRNEDGPKQKATDLLKPKKKNASLADLAQHPEYAGDIFDEDSLVKIYDTVEESYFFLTKWFYHKHEKDINAAPNLFPVEHHEAFDGFDDRMHEQVENLFDRDEGGHG